MATNKTVPTDAMVSAYLAALDDPVRREDCQQLVLMMSRITGHAPRMWGPSIVGFDQYHYRYASGREGDSCVTGFASRRSDISIYLVASDPDQLSLLASLGRHKMGKGCLSVRKLADLNLGILEQLITASVASVRRQHS